MDPERYPNPPEWDQCVDVEGSWPDDDLRRAFVRGAQWWLWHEKGCTMFGAERRIAEQEAERRYPGGHLPNTGVVVGER